jgi:hypothetical protein
MEARCITSSSLHVNVASIRAIRPSQAGLRTIPLREQQNEDIQNQVLGKAILPRTAVSRIPSPFVSRTLNVGPTLSTFLEVCKSIVPPSIYK